MRPLPVILILLLIGAVGAGMVVQLTQDDQASQTVPQTFPETEPGELEPRDDLVEISIASSITKWEWLAEAIDAGSRVGEALQHPLTAISLFVAGLASIALIGLSPVRVDAEWAGIILATSLASAGTGFGYSLANRSGSADAPAERDRTGGA